MAPVAVQPLFTAVVIELEGKSGERVQTYSMSGKKLPLAAAAGRITTAILKAYYRCSGPVGNAMQLLVLEEQRGVPALCARMPWEAASAPAVGGSFLFSQPARTPVPLRVDDGVHGASCIGTLRI